MKKIVAGIMAVCLCCGTFLSLNSDVLPNPSITADAVVTESTYEQITYKKYSDHIEISGCDKTVTYISVPAEISGLPVTSIGDEAFMECNDLKSLSLPQSILSIGEKAFYNCTNLISITLPKKLERIGSSAFENCKTIMSVSIPETVSVIEEKTFANCSKLNSIVIKNPDCQIEDPYDNGSAINNEMTSDGVCYFSGTIHCFNNSSAYAYAVKYKSHGYKYEIINNNDTEKFTTGEYKNLKFKEYPNHIEISECDEKADNVVIPDTINNLPVTVIGIAAFKNCTYLTTVSIPSSVEEISCYAFEGCTQLSSVTFSEGLKNIRSHAFCSCSSLTDITLPESVEKLGEGAFRNCQKLTKVTVQNPECEIYSKSCTISNGFNDNDQPYFSGTLSGYKNSIVKTFATSNGYKFTALPDKPAETTTTETKPTSRPTSAKTTTAKPSVTKPIPVSSSSALGDVNIDDSVDASDASMVLVEYSASSTGQASTLTAAQKIVADTNKDGTIDSSDASLILMFYAYNSTGGTESDMSAWLDSNK